jgi:flavin reductase (DIM6/NTAB) family NADH-FMN oxidoreductase RutF
MSVVEGLAAQRAASGAATSGTGPPPDPGGGRALRAVLGRFATGVTHSSIHQTVLECGSFAVSMLSARQEHVARYFADHSRPRGSAEFDAVGWTPAPQTGAPVLDGALAWVDCALAASYDGGDHAIFVGSVLASGCGPAHDALLFYSGTFHRPQLGAA